MYLGIDLGTSELKAVLLEPGKGVCAEARAPLRLSHPHPLWSEQDPGEWVAALEAAHPSLTLWVDNGIAEAAAARAWQARHRARLVLGSESQRDTACLAALDPAAVILSLDFRGETLLGPAALADPALWPETVIVMTLARIGAGEGPDWARLQEIRAKAEGRRVVAAGGVRDAADLERLAAMGIEGVLVASALHGGALPPAVLARFMPHRAPL